MAKYLLSIFFLIFSLSSHLLAQESDLSEERRFSWGWKYPNPEDDPEERNLPLIQTKALLPNEDSFKGGYNQLLSHIVAAPSQENAGSCLFMSHTGATEVILNQREQRSFNLSERYFMNLSKASIGDTLVTNWRTDTIYRLNQTRRFYLNKDYRFTKGWYKKNQDGRRVPALENEEGALYGVPYNWIVQWEELTNKPFLSLPYFKRQILFADPNQNQWNVGTAPRDIVTRVKKAIKEKNSPVIVIYNHIGSWHAVMIAGFNDQASSGNCPFVSSYNEKMNQRANAIVEEANRQVNPKIKRKLLRKAAKFRTRGQVVQTAFQEKGGCQGQGVFYVRDSIYPQKGNPLYDYDLEREGEETPLNAKIILREYEWLELLSNHAILIYTDS